MYDEDVGRYPSQQDNEFPLFSLPGILSALYHLGSSSHWQNHAQDKIGKAVISSFFLEWHAT